MLHDTEIDRTPSDPYTQGEVLVVGPHNIDLFRGGFLGFGGFYARPFRLKAGDRKPGHEHYINHAGLLLSGHARVHWRKPDGSERGMVDFTESWALMHVRADYWHEIEAVTDIEWVCLFAKTEADRIYGDAAKADWIMEKEHG